MSTAVVVGVVVLLMLLGVGMVINQLLRLRKFLRQPPAEHPPGEGEHPDSFG